MLRLGQCRDGSAPWKWGTKVEENSELGMLRLRQCMDECALGRERGLPVDHQFWMISFNVKNKINKCK